MSLGGSERRVIGRIIPHPGEVEVGAVFLADVTARIRCRLHQPVGLRRRDLRRIEGGFRDLTLPLGLNPV